MITPWIVPGKGARFRPTAVRAFTLSELLVVMAIVVLLAGLVLAVLPAAKSSAKKSSCLSNLHQLGSSVGLYLSDAEGRYPQTRTSSDDPAREDADGTLEEPDYGSWFALLTPYLRSPAVLDCSEAIDSRGAACDAPFPDHPDINSYLVNAFFIFGLSESGLARPTQTVMVSERRTETVNGSPFCNYTYRPWFNSSNPAAPEDDLDDQVGAMATRRHLGKLNVLFADNHVATIGFRETLEFNSP